MAGPRVLTFNFHEPYLCLMARTGYPITVGQYETGQLQRGWHTTFRPLPRNIDLAPESEWRRDLQAGKFDVVVAHNETNAASVYHSGPPALLVCHNRRSFIRTHFPPDQPGELRAFDRLLDRLQERFNFVFISESKRDDYGIPGRVILPGIDVDEYGGYEGERPEVLRVGNSMRERNLMFDVDFQEAVVAGLPNRVLGVNELIPDSSPAESFEHLLWHYRHLRALLHVSREDYEDGYNLAMLEAMACGMPVVSLANASSPILDGGNGFASYDAATLHARLQNLLADLDLARTIGAQGRETVAAQFPMQRFVNAWQEAFEETAERRGIQPRWVKAAPPERRVVLLQYDAGPAGTARMLEWALRRNHEVVTMGRCLARAPKAPRYPAQQIDVQRDDVEAELNALYASGRGPEVHIVVQEHPDALPTMPQAVAHLPHVCWVMHNAPDVERLGAMGFANVVQLPPACAPELFIGVSREANIDVLVAVKHTGRRVALAESLRALGTIVAPETLWPYDLAKLVVRSRIVIVAAGADSTWISVQAMGAGALVMVEGNTHAHEPAHAIPGKQTMSPMGDTLPDTVVWCSEEELLAEVKRWLGDADSRIRSAEAARRRVLAHHTYERRMEQLMNAIAEVPVEQTPQDQRLEVGGYYRSPRPEFAVHVPQNARRLLDVGCGAGEFGRALKAERGVNEVVGIEIVESAWRIARTVLDQAILGNIEQMELPFGDGHFDCITCGDVLEHLVDPLATLNKLKRVLAPGGVIVASIPNARFYQVVEMLGNGRWVYQDAGIMDRTHLRFFTGVEMLELFRASGLRVTTLAPLSMMNEGALPISDDGYIQLQKMRIGPLTPSEYHDFLVYQYLVIAGHRTGNLLDKAKAMLDAKDNQQAYDTARAALDEGEDRASCLRVLAKAGARTGKVAEAETWYRESLTLREDAEVRGEYGLILFALGRCVDARTQLEIAHTAIPGHGRILSGLGLCDLAAGNVQAAFDHFKQSLDRDFDNEAAVEHLVGAAQQLNRLAEAEPFVRRFVEFYPGNLDMGCVYAAVLLEMGRSGEARECLENVLLFQPEHENARTLLGQIESHG